MKTGRMLEEWRKSALVLIFWNREDVQSCNCYKRYKADKSHNEAGGRNNESQIQDSGYDFMPRKGTTEVIFAPRILMNVEGQKELQRVRK